MDPQIATSRSKGLWELAARQHGVVARRQLLALGFDGDAIRHRVAMGRLHRVRRGVFAVGRPVDTAAGRWMAAVLACFPSGVLSHQSAAAVWCILEGIGLPHVTVPRRSGHRPPGLIVHRRELETHELMEKDGIPVTAPFTTLVDVAASSTDRQVEAAITEADKRGVLRAFELPSRLEGFPTRPGLARLRRVVGRHAFRMTDSELERRFLALVRRSGLPEPLTGAYLNGYKTDFHWPELRLVVETDGLAYHRTAAAQAKDRLRDQAHTAAGLTPLRFTHAQVRYEPAHVIDVLQRVIAVRSGAL